jgi:tetratricopeptide (TPR) repeat protein
MEVIMRTTALIVLIFSMMSFSLCIAAETPVEKAYDLFYQGKSDQAIELIEDYVKDTPDASAYYFLGYAYYEKNEIDKAMEYFSKSFKLKSFYSPMEQKE